MSKLMLVSDSMTGKTLDPVLMKERAAARYLNICVPRFRELVKAGHIPARRHKGGLLKIYLREDLDLYARALEVLAV